MTLQNRAGNSVLRSAPGDACYTARDTERASAAHHAPPSPAPTAGRSAPVVFPVYVKSARPLDSHPETEKHKNQPSEETVSREKAITAGTR